MITERQLDHIAAHAETEWPFCACGIILTDGTILPCENLARDKKVLAEIGNFEKSRIGRCSPPIGYYRSRPGTLLPVESDYAFADEFGMYYVVATVHDRGVNELVTQTAIYRLCGTPTVKSFEHISIRAGVEQVRAVFTQRS